MKRYRRSSRLTKSQEKPKDYLAELLTPLKRGQMVKLVISFEKMHGKHKREVKLLALFAPGKMYGMVSDALVVSVIGKGSCVIFPRNEKGLAGLTGLGIPVASAKVLKETLQTLYGVEEHDNQT